MKKVNLIVPCYNEAEALPLFKDELNKVIQTLDQYTFEILLINDGSTDTTLSVMKEICDTDSHYKYISFSRNFGKEAVMSEGICACANCARSIRYAFNVFSSNRFWFLQ